MIITKILLNDSEGVRTFRHLMAKHDISIVEEEKWPDGFVVVVAASAPIIEKMLSETDLDWKFD